MKGCCRDRRIPIIVSRGNVCWQMDLNPASKRVARILLTVHRSHCRLGVELVNFTADNSHLAIYMPAFCVVAGLLIHTASPRIQILSDALVTILENSGNLNSEILTSTFNQISLLPPSPLLKVISFLPLQSLFSFPRH